MQFISKSVLSNAGTDEVYVPRQVMCRNNVSDNAKLMFGLAFSECLSKMKSFDEETVLQAADIVKRYCADIRVSTIEKECMCSTEEAVMIKEDLLSLTSTAEIADCLHECKLCYIRIQKPACNVCGNGKMLYKMVDLINTITDRTLHGDKKHTPLSEDELLTLKSYNESCSPELLNTVIDILKR